MTEKRHKKIRPAFEEKSEKAGGNAQWEQLCFSWRMEQRREEEAPAPGSDASWMLPRSLLPIPSRGAGAGGAELKGPACSPAHLLLLRLL